MLKKPICVPLILISFAAPVSAYDHGGRLHFNVPQNNGMLRNVGGRVTPIQPVVPVVPAPNTLSGIVVQTFPNRVMWRNVKNTILEVDLVVVYNGAQFQLFDGQHGLGNFPQTLGYAGKGWVDCITYPIGVLLITNRGTLTFGTYPKAPTQRAAPLSPDSLA
jgi:hypothetical protein